MAEQLRIDFDALRACRASDPVSSINAAEHAAVFAATHAGRILQALKTHGPRTAHDLSQIVGLTVVQIDRRLPDLKNAKRARVQQLADGGDRMQGGFRVWEAL
jgi:hypothetical protein